MYNFKLPAISFQGLYYVTYKKYIILTILLKVSDVKFPNRNQFSYIFAFSYKFWWNFTRWTIYLFNPMSKYFSKLVIALKTLQTTSLEVKISITHIFTKPVATYFIHNCLNFLFLINLSKLIYCFFLPYTYISDYYLFTLFFH